VSGGSQQVGTIPTSEGVLSWGWVSPGGGLRSYIRVCRPTGKSVYGTVGVRRLRALQQAV